VVVLKTISMQFPGFLAMDFELELAIATTFASLIAMELINFQCSQVGH
jgi:hypothetical protein